MMNMIDKQTIFMFAKNSLIRHLCASCHMTNDDAKLYDVTDISKSIEGNFDNMSTAKKGKLHVNMRHVTGSKRLHTLWLVKYCANAGVIFFLLTYKHSQR